MLVLDGRANLQVVRPIRCPVGDVYEFGSSFRPIRDSHSMPGSNAPSSDCQASPHQLTGFYGPTLLSHPQTSVSETKSCQLCRLFGPFSTKRGLCVLTGKF